MTRKKEPRTGDERSMPSRQAQDEVLNGLGAEVDEESGEVLVDEDRVHEVGAVDVDAVRENQRRDEYIRQKKDGKKKVPFNTPDVLMRYEIVLTQFPASTLNIFVQRLTGGVPAQYTITSRPNSGVELYAAMQKIHGVSDSAEYQVNIQDAHQRTWRGTGRITMPDTRDHAVPQQLPPQPYFAPSPQVAPVAAAPAPIAAPSAPAAGPLDTIAIVEQLFNLFQRMTPAPVAPVTVASTAAPTPQQMFAQVAPMLTDPTMQVEGIGKLFDLFQKAQAAQAGAPTAVAPQAGLPPGMIHVPGVGYVTAEYLAQELSRREPASQPGPRRPYAPPRREDQRGHDPRDEDPRGPPPRYGHRPQYEGHDRYDPRYDPRPRYDDRGPPPRERSPISELRTALSTVHEMREILGGGLGGSDEREHRDPESSEDDEDSPFQVIESGGARLLAHKDTKKVAVLESIAINLPGAFKWIGEQAQTISKAQEQQRAQQQAPPMPEPARRFVEVIDPPLPPPPDRIPPPISPSGWEDSPPDMPFGASEEG